VIWDAMSSTGGGCGWGSLGCGNVRMLRWSEDASCIAVTLGVGSSFMGLHW
jgi:hypothetical protein